MSSSFGGLRVNPEDPRPLYVQIMDEVRRAVSRGALEPDTALPSVRELAARLRVNPNTVLQAYRELEHEDLVYVRRGRGTFVSPSASRSELRDRVATELARQCLRDAARSGLSASELVDAIRAETRDPSSRDPSHDD